MVFDWEFVPVSWRRRCLDVGTSWLRETFSWQICVSGVNLTRSRGDVGSVVPRLHPYVNEEKKLLHVYGDLLESTDNGRKQQERFFQPYL